MLNEYQFIIELLAFNLIIQSFPYNELIFSTMLGKGAFGNVYQGCWKDKKITIKILKRNSFHNEGAKKLSYMKCTLWAELNISIWFVFWAIVSKA
jgi:hypothetical protein